MISIKCIPQKLAEFTLSLLEKKNKFVIINRSYNICSKVYLNMKVTSVPKDFVN